MTESAIAMADRIEHWPLADLVPYANNARTHSPAQIDKIAASMVEFGFTAPILVDGDDGILAGHGRLLAAKKLGMEVVPVIQLAHLDDKQRRAYILADNRIAQDAGWNADLLAAELQRLSEDGFDLTLTGFDEREIAEFLAEEEGVAGEAQEGSADSGISRPGDVWLLGSHRLEVGDVDPRACDAVVTSWQAFTGFQAKHAASGETFAAVSSQRLG